MEVVVVVVEPLPLDVLDAPLVRGVAEEGEEEEEEAQGLGRGVVLVVP